MLPRVLVEQLISPFVFYRDGELRQGMRCNGCLYELVNEFGANQRLTAYYSICDLVEQGNDALVTASEFSYRGWINIQSAGYLHWTASKNSGRTFESPTAAPSVPESDPFFVAA